MIISTIVDQGPQNRMNFEVYTDLIISTIVDKLSINELILRVYTDLIISTIVDEVRNAVRERSLYGLDNFYYRRLLCYPYHSPTVYTDLIISTIVDLKKVMLDDYDVYTDLIISTIVDDR